MTDYSDVKRLPDFVLIIVMIGLILGAGLIAIGKMGSNAYYNARANNTITPLNSTSVALAFGNLTSVVSVKLARNQQDVGSNNYTIDLTNGSFRLTEIANDSTGCGVCNLTINGTSVELIYDFKNYNTETVKSTTKITIELGKIPTDWLGLIVTIVVLAIIMIIVMKSFGFMQGGRQ